MEMSKIWIFLFIFYGFLEVGAQTVNGTDGKTPSPVQYPGTDAPGNPSGGKASTPISYIAPNPAGAETPEPILYILPNPYANQTAGPSEANSSDPSGATQPPNNTPSPNSGNQSDNSVGNNTSNPTNGTSPDYYDDDDTYHHGKGWKWAVVSICMFFIFTIFWIIFCKFCMGLCLLTCFAACRPKVIYKTRVNPYDGGIYSTDRMGHVPPLPVQTLPMYHRPFTAPYGRCGRF